jgi:hypothetical protein
MSRRANPLLTKNTSSKFVGINSRLKNNLFGAKHYMGSSTGFRAQTKKLVIPDDPSKEMKMCLNNESKK